MVWTEISGSGMGVDGVVGISSLFSFDLILCLMYKTNICFKAKLHLKRHTQRD